jgi:signal transduction histidine kinase
MLNTIFRNLISNAIKFTDENGMITAYANAMGDFIEITISDTGVGIPDENLNKIFLNDHYFKTEGTFREKGLGLGLQIVKDFVEKNGGKIYVKSEVGKGSNFIVTLPRNKMKVD